MNSEQDFYDWTFEMRGDFCKCISNDPVGVNNENIPAKAVFWSEKEMDFPSTVTVQSYEVADGSAPAVEEDEVEGWHKYEVQFKSD